MWKFVRDRWFLLLLLLTLAVGILAAPYLRFIAEQKLIRDLVVAVVLFMMALPLEPRTIWGVLRRPTAALLAFAMTYGLLPLVAWAAAQLLSRELAVGLLVAATTPCTLATTTVMTRRAGGNDTVATMVTILTNLVCFVLMPLWLALMLGVQVQSAEFEFSRAVMQLGKLVVAPMIAAQLVRLLPTVGEFAQRRKVPLATCCQIGILYMVLSGAIHTGFSLFGPNSTPPAWWEFLLMMVVVQAVHLFVFWVGWRLAKTAGLARPDQIAVAFSGSQKTLMIGLKVALDLGVSVLPMVTFHVGQLIIDIIIADQLRLLHTAQDAGASPENRPSP